MWSLFGGASSPPAAQPAAPAAPPALAPLRPAAHARAGAPSLLPRALELPAVASRIARLLGAGDCLRLSLAAQQAQWARAPDDAAESPASPLAAAAARLPQRALVDEALRFAGLGLAPPPSYFSRERPPRRAAAWLSWQRGPERGGGGAGGGQSWPGDVCVG